MHVFSTILKILFNVYCSITSACRHLTPLQTISAFHGNFSKQPKQLISPLIYSGVSEGGFKAAAEVIQVETQQK